MGWMCRLPRKIVHRRDPLFVLQSKSVVVPLVVGARGFHNPSPDQVNETSDILAKNRVVGDAQGH